MRKSYLDSDSTDGTKDIFRSTPTVTSKEVLNVGSGKGTALVEFWKFASANRIPYIATIDADLSSITPVWIRSLIEPVKDGQADAVLPLYARNRFKANITNQFAYPLLKSIYGVDVRQPLAGEFGYGRDFYEDLLGQKKYDPTFKYGIDIFITSSGLSGNFQIINPDLRKKDDKPSFYHQEETFLEVSESGLLLARKAILNGSNIGVKKPIGPDYYCSVDDSLDFPHKAEIPSLLPKLKKQYDDNVLLIERYFGPLKTGIEQNVSDDQCKIGSDLWTDVLAKAIILATEPQFKQGEIKDLVRALLPIYRWRVITFWLSVETASADSVEEQLRNQAEDLRRKVALI